ncbi:hypothetical protein AAFF_G00389670 [Aldrovandia affinis]|uniref:Uncharacterized protein n=1 Tax=Aldrovandia affinis TaxID=143900 RepID=A0AAD7WLE3_9TELE|nr:hypothetical protein AAFF_G00389670 [Aldrovandia affinis]
MCWVELQGFRPLKRCIVVDPRPGLCDALGFIPRLEQHLTFLSGSIGCFLSALIKLEMEPVEPVSVIPQETPSHQAVPPICLLHTSPSQ